MEAEACGAGARSPLLSEGRALWKAKPPSRVAFACIVGGILVAWTVAMAVLLGPGYGGAAGGRHGPVSPAELEELVTPLGVMNHLQRFMQVAQQSDIVSRSVRNAYNTSAEYVELKLHQASRDNGYFHVHRQYFVAPVWSEESPPTLSVHMGDTTTLALLHTTDFLTLRYSGPAVSGAVERAPVRVLESEAAACGAGLAPGSLAGRVAVVSSNSTLCDIYAKAVAAQTAGALALIVYRNTADGALSNPRVRDAEWTAESPWVTIPALSVRHTLGHLLLAAQVTVSMVVDTQTVFEPTFNIIADSAYGNPNSTIALTAHLDSVPEGPGINDNGSGAGAILEIAYQLGMRNSPLVSRLRFIFCGAEELGLLGSRHYIRDLQARANETNELEQIRLNLNFDMLGSPNYARLLYEASTAPEAVQPQCQTLMALFEHYFQARGLGFSRIPFSTTGGSDYFPFLYAGIPSSSIMAGASGLKTLQEREDAGGSTGGPYDSCYHQACDTPENINMQGLREMVGAATYVTAEVMAQDWQTR